MRNELIQSLDSPYRAHMKEHFFNLQSCAGSACAMYIWALVVTFRVFEAKRTCTLVQDEIWIKMKDDRLTVLVSPTNQIKNWWCCRDESPVDRLTRVFSVLGNNTLLPPNTSLTLQPVLLCKLAQTTCSLWCNLQVHRHHGQAQIIITAFPNPQWELQGQKQQVI